MEQNTVQKPDCAAITAQARQAAEELLAAAHLRAGDIFVVGCSSSEIVGGHIGKDSSMEAAAAVLAAILPVLKAQGVYLAEFRDRDAHEKLAVGPGDLRVGYLGRARQAAHFVAGFVERYVALLQPADHLGGIVGIDKVGDTGHAQCAERGGAALDVEVHEDAAEVEYYVFDLIHKLL